MKQFVIASIIAFGIWAAASTVGHALTQCEPGPNQVAVFQHANFVGSCNILNLAPDRTPTGYIRAGWREFTLSNDSVSSLKVGKGVYVTLFEDTYFAGTHASYNTGSWPGIGWVNDLTSSIRITPVERDCRRRVDGSLLPLQRNEIAVYEDSFYLGDCVQIRSSDDFGNGQGFVMAMFSANFELRSASSIRLGPSTNALLCRSAFLSGYCETFNAWSYRMSDTQFGNDWLYSLMFQEL